MKPILINLFGGPGISKSTAAGGIYTLLKIHSVNCELVPEFAKELVWKKNFESLKNQIYIFGEQYHRVWSLRDQVDVVISDSPILLPIIYDNDEERKFFRPLVEEMFHSFNNLNFLLIRDIKYDTNGRYQDENGAKEIDKNVEKLLLDKNLLFERVKGNHNAINYIAQNVLKLLGKEQEFFISKNK